VNATHLAASKFSFSIARSAMLRQLIKQTKASAIQKKQGEILCKEWSRSMMFEVASARIACARACNTMKKKQYSGRLHAPPNHLEVRRLESTWSEKTKLGSSKSLVPWSTDTPRCQDRQLQQCPIAKSRQH
jgi:hypothetical protein